MHQRNSSAIYSFIQFIALATRCPSSRHIHHPCLKSNPFLYFSRDHLRWRIICGPFRGSFAIGDHLRYSTVLQLNWPYLTKFRAINLSFSILNKFGIHARKCHAHLLKLPHPQILDAKSLLLL